MTLIRKVGREELNEEEVFLKEWLVTNGLGGYASGTLGGAVTRRYHGLLVAALPTPLGRVVLLSEVEEKVRLPGWNEARYLSGGSRGTDAFPGAGSRYLAEFRLEWGLPVWRYDVEGVILEKRIFFSHLQNTVYLVYELVESEARAELLVRPSVDFRPHETPVSQPLPEPIVFKAIDERYEVSASPKLPVLRLRSYGRGRSFTLEARRRTEVIYPVEETRGYESRGRLWSPGYLSATMVGGETVSLVASTEVWDMVEALPPEMALEAELERRQGLIRKAHPSLREGVGAELVLAADQFVIVPASRATETARAHAAGEEPRTIIAGYHWFTDWGRDTMISLEGLTLHTGRPNEAAYILKLFGAHLKDGLIPNMFPEHRNEGIYNTVDATLWFFHAIHRYTRFTGDWDLVKRLLPILEEIVENHLVGTLFGIGVDPADGLLRQGEEGVALTWMDAKMEDWVVTPRRGKPVEINALWYNALSLLRDYLEAAGNTVAANRAAEHAERARVSFNRRFWYPEGNYLFDIVDGEDGDDPALRPNQVLAIALDYPVLDEARWRPVVDTVRKHLLAPPGLRSLDPRHPDYKRTYHGDLRTRDAAYHQGTIWSWLVGPYVDAWLRAYPDEKAEAWRAVKNVTDQLGRAGIGSISEIFDAEPPFTPRGCIAQAWSISEVLRCWRLLRPLQGEG